MFHLAQRCPHCGAAAPARDVKPEISVEEAKSLLQATTPPRAENFADIAVSFVLPRGGLVEVVTSVLAAPLTIFTVLVTGYFLVREKASRREAQLVSVRLLAVPVCAALAATLLFSRGAPLGSFVALLVSFAAWGARTFTRRA